MSELSAATLKVRSRVIGELLSRWEDLVDPQQARGTFGDDSSVGFGLMPASYSSSVREIERLLRVLKVADRGLWWQLHQRFMLVRRVQRQVSRRVRGPQGRRVTERVWVRLEVWDSRVEARRVEEGLMWLAREWGLAREPESLEELVARMDQARKVRRRAS